MCFQNYFGCQGQSCQLVVNLNWKGKANFHLKESKVPAVFLSLKTEKIILLHWMSTDIRVTNYFSNNETTRLGSSGCSGWVRGGGKKHEIYVAIFFMTYFYKAGGWPLRPPPVSATVRHRSDSIQGTDYIANDYIILSSWIWGFLDRNWKSKMTGRGGGYYLDNLQKICNIIGPKT